MTDSPGVWHVDIIKQNLIQRYGRRSGPSQDVDKSFSKKPLFKPKGKKNRWKNLSSTGFSFSAFRY